MARKSFKAKEPVRLRFKELADGNKSIYLDIYKDGTRHYEFLKLYLVPERTHADRLQNEQSLRAAAAIKSQRIIEFSNAAAGTPVGNMGKMLLCDWLQNCVDKKTLSAKSTHQNYGIAAKHVMQYAAAGTRLKDVTKDFCSGFIRYLRYEYKTTTGRPLSQFAVREYVNMFNSMLNMAVRERAIATNPMGLIDTADKVSTPNTQRVYLTQAELKSMIQTPCKNEAVKNAFLFSCFCGLRISDIERLEWKDIIKDGAQTRIIITMQKTKQPLYIPVSKQALKYMPENESRSDVCKVFDGLPKRVAIMNHVKNWAAAAGITKNVSFHTARHTFATSLLTEGADLYTVSKLLGHTEISTTQIYAKIIDKKKDEAVSLLDNIF